MTDDSPSAPTGVVTALPRTRRAPNRVDYIVRAPLGLIWFAIMIVVAVPVLLYMTVLYHVVQGVGALLGRAGRTRRPPGRAREERERVA
jgi:hypothetical protein